MSDAKEMLRKIGDAIQAVAATSTVPLISRLPDGSTDIGSAVLVRVDGRPMLFTAAHVIENAVRRGGTLQSVHGVDLAGVNVVVSPNPNQTDDETRLDAPRFRRRDGDRFDIAWVNLSLEQADRYLSNGLRFLGSGEIWTGYEQPTVVLVRGPFALFGYPAAAARGDASRVRASAQLCALPAADGGQVILGGRELVLYYRRDSVALTGDGQRIEPLHPGGFSGCGVWSYPVVRLVGIFHTWDEPAGVGRATTTPAFFDGLVDMDPDLARGLRAKVGP